MPDKELEDAILNKVSEYLSIYDSAYIHKQSFNYFLNHRLSKIIEEEPIIEVQISENKYYNVHFGQIFVDKPYIIDENRQIRYIYPNETRLRDLTYSSLVSINIKTFITEKDSLGNIINESDVQEHNKIHLARIPIMV
jgi:DNA-directed RNA polymerase II subunit RPB2